jgi:hypothetical protein
MRIRVAAIITLLLPATLSAQRIPLPGTRRGPARPAELPPQPGAIAQELAYKRMRLSIESYPMVMYAQGPRFAGTAGPSSWTALGAGTRADYELTPHLSATLDLTSSLYGGPAITQTAEIGTRIHPERSESRIFPFADVRFGYIAQYNKNFGTIDDPYGYTLGSTPYGTRYSRGFGGVAGLGMDYALSRSFSLNTTFSVMRNRMTWVGLESAQRAEGPYAMTFYRYTLGLRYNPVRVIRAVETDLR